MQEENREERRQEYEKQMSILIIINLPPCFCWKKKFNEIKSDFLIC